jgi:hypothetical protein
MRRVASYIGVAVISLLVGVYLGSRYIGKPVATLAPILGAAWVGERAALLFHEANYAEAHEALLKYAEVNKELAARPDLGWVDTAQSDLSLTYMRLAILEERRGNTGEAAQYVSQAVSYAKQAGWKHPTAERIRWLVENIEKHAQTTPTPVSGRGHR